MVIFHGYVSLPEGIYIYIILYNMLICLLNNVAGWWFQPLFKQNVSWDYYSQDMEKIKNVPNHQPGWDDMIEY